MNSLHYTTTVLHRRARALAPLAAALALGLGAASQAQAVPACKIDLVVRNDQPKSVKVLRLEYTVLGVKHYEPLLNKRLAPGETEDWQNQALQHAAEGAYISNTRVEYKEDNSGAGDGYGPPKWSDYFPHTPGYLCYDDRDYWLAVR
jgi:hypothetical protein